MIRELLTGKTAKERAQIKSAEIAKRNHKGKFLRGELEIEITDLKEIEGGIEVFARAWKNGKQLGFGKDGSVDIERFRIINPPILVPDPDGEVVVISEEKKNPDATPVLVEKRYRENVSESILQVIEHNLLVMENIHADRDIVFGRVGNTTTTVYASAGDGQITSQPYPGSWADQRSNTTGRDVNYTSTTAMAGDGSFTYASGYLYIQRVFLPFDTSSIPDTDSISSASLSLYATAKTDYYNNAYAYIALVAGTQANTSTLANSDFGSVGTTILAANMDITGVTTSAYNTFSLNASGLAHLSKTGFTKFALRGGHDLENYTTDFSSGGDGAWKECNITTYMSEQSGTTTDPKLVIEHAAVSSFIPKIMMS